MADTKRGKFTRTTPDPCEVDLNFSSYFFITVALKRHGCPILFEHFRSRVERGGVREKFNSIRNLGISM